MGRPPKIDDDALLAAAQETFLEHGFGIATSEIAKRAGVSEGSIFKRFETKEALFFAALLGRKPPEWIERARELVGQGDVQKNLTELGREILAFFREAMPRFMMLKAGCPAPKNPTLFEGGVEPPPVRGLKSLTYFFTEEKKLGRVADGDPEVFARMFIGSLANFAMFEAMGFSTRTDEEADAYAAQLVSSMWTGIAP